MTDSTFTPAQGQQLSAALESARGEIVVAIAFLSRDLGTDRLNDTADSLITRLAKADADARAALAASQLPAAPVERTWDQGEHEGCGIDSQRAYEREVAEPSRCKNPVAPGERKGAGATTGDAPGASASTLHQNCSAANEGLDATERGYLEDNIATVAHHLGQPDAFLSVHYDGNAKLLVDPGEVLQEISRRLSAVPQSAGEPGNG